MVRGNMTEFEPPKIGLALGGGAALGWAHIGIINCLLENDIRPQIISGTSIGSMVGGCFAAGKLGDLEEVSRSITWSQMLTFADIQFGKNGFLGGTKVVKELEGYLAGLEIENLAMPFGAVAVDLIAGEEVVLAKGALIDAIRASISIPGVFTPVRMGDALLVDGGLMNTVPVSVCRELGADFIIGVNVVADYLGRADSTGLLIQPNAKEILQDDQEVVRSRKLAARLTAWKESAQKAFRKPKTDPGFLGVGIASGALIMRELAKGQISRCPPDFLLEPKVGHIMPIEFNRADELIDIGWQFMEAQLPALKRSIESKER
jgi:NTE family protein